MDFDDLKVGIDLFKSAIGLAKEAKDLLPDSDQKTTIVSSLDTAEQTTAIAVAQIAKALDYRLCQCTFPPQIMLSIGYDEDGIEKFKCHNCNKEWPPEVSDEPVFFQPDI
jgi:hypothetical protein